MHPQGTPEIIPGATAALADMEVSLLRRAAAGAATLAVEAWRRLTAPRTPEQRFMEDMSGGAGDMGAVVLTDYMRRQGQGEQ